MKTTNIRNITHEYAHVTKRVFDWRVWGPIHKENFCNENCNKNCNEIQFWFCDMCQPLIFPTFLVLEISLQFSLQFVLQFSLQKFSLWIMPLHCGQQLEQWNRNWKWHSLNLTFGLRVWLWGSAETEGWRLTVEGSKSFLRLSDPSSPSSLSHVSKLVLHCKDDFIEHALF